MLIPPQLVAPHLVLLHVNSCLLVEQIAMDNVAALGAAVTAADSFVDEA